MTAACAYNMSLQPRYNPMSRSNFFADQRSGRPVVEGAVANNQKGLNAPFNTGRANGTEIADIPVPVTLDLLRRGRDRFDIYCSPCHSRLGDGEGIVVQRGFVHPPSYHSDRLRSAPAGHFFGVMTDGFGRMWSYASRVEVPDRWAIAAYIRALQLSQYAPLADVPQNELQPLLRKTQ
jgi:mono/diheme cytochrome c family protein